MSFIYEDLYQFTTYAPPIDLSFHQYLLLGDEPMLVHTGTQEQALALAPQLKQILGPRQLKYIFVSHFESDECGGLASLVKEHPEARTLCSEVTARQLRGFGITDRIAVKKPGETLASASLELEFIAYPSEMHLWEGLLLMEKRRGIFFSSDLMLRFGKAEGEIIEGNWQSEVETVTSEKIPDAEKREGVKEALRGLNPKFIAVGHGPCVRL